MLKDYLVEIFDRDIHKVISEINSYTKEENIWLIKGDIKNSAGNLCMHLIGNLKYFIGSVLGNIDYERNREVEFSGKGVPREEIVKGLEETVAIVTGTLKNLNEKDLEGNFPHEIFKREMSSGSFMIHLVAHLNYHLGQINYHRRFIDS